VNAANIFDLLLAVRTSLVEPLLHQISIAHEAMHPRQPFHFLLSGISLGALLVT